MKPNKVYLVYLILLIFSIMPSVYAQINLGYPIKAEQAVTLPQVCDNCTYVNITTLKYPNSSIVYINSVMIKDGNTYSYILNSSFVSNTGIYSYTTCGDLNAQLTCQTVDFEVTKTGAPFDLSKTIFYVTIFLFSIAIFIGLLVTGINLPSNNQRDAMTGYILSVNNLKYLKIFLFGLAYVALIAILYFGYVISYSFLDMNFVGNILYFCFYASVVILLPIFIVGTYLVIANWVRDSKIADALQRGIRLR